MRIDARAYQTKYDDANICTRMGRDRLHMSRPMIWWRWHTRVSREDCISPQYSPDIAGLAAFRWGYGRPRRIYYGQNMLHIRGHFAEVAWFLDTGSADAPRDTGFTQISRISVKSRRLPLRSSSGSPMSRMPLSSLLGTGRFPDDTGSSVLRNFMLIGMLSGRPLAAACSAAFGARRWYYRDGISFHAHADWRSPYSLGHTCSARHQEDGEGIMMASLFSAFASKLFLPGRKCCAKFPLEIDINRKKISQHWCWEIDWAELAFLGVSALDIGITPGAFWYWWCRCRCAAGSGHDFEHFRQEALNICCLRRCDTLRWAAIESSRWGGAALFLIKRYGHYDCLMIRLIR